MSSLQEKFREYNNSNKSTSTLVSKLKDYAKDVDVGQTERILSNTTSNKTTTESSSKVVKSTPAQALNKTLQNMQNAYEMHKVEEGAKLVNQAQNLMNMQQNRILKGAGNLTDYAKALPSEKIKEIKGTSGVLHPELLEKKNPDAKYYFGKFYTGTGEAVENIADATVALGSNVGKMQTEALEKVTSLGGLLPNKISENYRNVSEDLQKIKESAYANDFLPTKEVTETLEYEYSPNKVEAIVGDVLSGTGGMLPTIASNLLVPGSGYVTLGLQGAGGGTKQAYEKTGNLGAKEEIYGLLSGLSEIAVEKLSGGIGGLGNGTIDNIASKLIKNGFIRNATGEGIEEAVSTFIDPYLQRLTYDKGAEGAKASEVLRSAIVGALTSMLLQGGSAAVNSVNTSLNTDKSVKKLNKIDNKTLSQLEEINNNLEKGKTFSEVANLPEMDKATQKQLKGLENLIPQKNVASELPITPSQIEDKTAQNGNIEQIAKNIENNNILEYNNNRGVENEQEINKRNDARRIQELFEIYRGGQKNSKADGEKLLGLENTTENVNEGTIKKALIEYANKYPKTELTPLEKELTKIIEDKGGRLVIYEMGGNNSMQGLSDNGTMYVDALGESDIKDVFYHDIVHVLRQNNDEIYMREIQPIVNEIASDYDKYQEAIFNYANSVQDFDIRYLDGSKQQELAEEVMGDTVASIYSSMQADYGLPPELISQIKNTMGRTLNTNNPADTQSAFSMPKNEVQSFASSESQRPYMDLDRYTSRDNKSKANQTRLTDIQNAINDIVTVKTGKFRQNAYGIYKTHGEIIRLKQSKDIPVALHELTHHLDKKYNLSSSDKAFNELKKIAVVGKNATKQTTIAEGVAEFGRYYMTDKEYAKEIAPNYYDTFEKALSNDPGMKDKVENIRQMVTNYLDQSPLNRLSSNIDYGDEQMSLWGKAKDSILKTAHNFRKNFVDDLDPLKKIVNEIVGDKKLMTEEDAYKLLRLNNGVTGKVQVALEYGVVDKNGEKIGKSLKEILKPVASEQKEFTAYLTALRAKDLRDRGVESGLLSRDVDDVIKAYSKNETFNKASEELYNFQNQILETTLVDSGIITKDAMKAYNKNNPHYVPFYRVMDENFKQSKDSKSKKPMKIKGSTRDIINPLESIIKNTYSYMQMAERNDTYKTLFNMANKYDGTGKWFDKVPTDMTGTTVTAEDVKSILEQLNLGEEDVNYNEIFTTLFKPANNQKGNIVTVMERGKPVHYEINDKELYDILSPTIKGDNFIVKMLAPASKALRVGATHTPEFVLRNPIRDTQEAGIYSKNGFIPVVDTMIGIFNVAGRSDLYYKWLQSGGSGSTYTNAQRPVLQKTLKGLTEGVTNEKITKKALKGVGNLAKHPLRTYLDVAGAISNVAEEGTRVGEFRRALKQGKTEKEAALDSREITLDFARGGKNAKDINKVVAFFNAEVQGLDKVITSFKDRPVATFLKALAYTTLPAILLRGLQDEEKLEKVPQWEKDEFFIVFFGDTPIKIPKGQGLGQIFGTIPERAIDYLRTHDRDAFDGLMQRLVTSYVPIDSTTSIFPNFFLPLIENSANYSFFRQQPIVSKSLENRSPRYQYDESTSTVAKTIGNLTNISPKKIDNLISGYTGNLGKDITNLAGIPIEWLSGEQKKEYKSTNAKLKQIPLLKGFVAGNTASKELDKFYENKAKASTDYTDAKFKYSDGNKTKAEEKELNYYKEINSLYNSAYNDIKEIDEKMDEVRKGPGTDKYKESKLKGLKNEKEKIANDVEGKVKNKQLKAMNVKFNK